MLIPISVGDGLGKRHYQIIGWCCGAHMHTHTHTHTRACLLCIQQKDGTPSHSETWTFSSPTMELMTFSV